MPYRCLLAFSFTVFMCGSARSWAAPTDFNGDGRSDPSSVAERNPLRWRANLNGQNTAVIRGFGVLGDHIAAAHYSGSSATEPAYIDKDGNWHILIQGREISVTHGAPESTYLAGADADGNGQADALYHTNTCRPKRLTLHALLNPASPAPEKRQITGGQGRFFTTYADINGDGKDDFCWLSPIRAGGKLRSRFIMRCKDVQSGSVVKKLRLGRVFERPMPIAFLAGAPDYIAIPRGAGRSISVRIVNQRGRLVRRILFPGTGHLLVGSFIPSGQPEQLALAEDASLLVFEAGTGSFVRIPAPAGIKFDEFNVNQFEPLSESCICTSADIMRTGRCPRFRPGRGDGGDIGGSCQVEREISDGPLGWLHKGISDTTGSVVNLFRPEDDPQNCRYEDTRGKLFQEAIYRGNSNPNRPTWRPAKGGSCKNFPKPLVVSCIVKGKKNCWLIPNPCGRYD